MIVMPERRDLRHRVLTVAPGAVMGFVSNSSASRSKIDGPFARIIVTQRLDRLYFKFRSANGADLVLTSRNRAGRFFRYDPIT